MKVIVMKGTNDCQTISYIWNWKNYCFHGTKLKPIKLSLSERNKYPITLLPRESVGSGRVLKEQLLKQLGYTFQTLKSLRFEDQIETFPYSFQEICIGKIVSPFRGPKLPQNIRQLTRCFLPVTFA